MRSALVYLGIYLCIYIVLWQVMKHSRKNALSFGSIFSMDYTTIIKGIAISIIVYGHCGNNFGIRYLTPLGGIGVAMFLMLSGFGINESWKKNGHKQYWRKRFISFFVPYCIVEIVAIPLRGGTPRLQSAYLIYRDYSRNIAMDGILHFFWGSMCYIIC